MKEEQEENKAKSSKTNSSKFSESSKSPQILKESNKAKQSKRNKNQIEIKKGKTTSKHYNKSKTSNESIADASSNTSDTEEELADFKALDLDNLKVAQLPKNKNTEKIKTNSRATLKKSLLKNLKIKEDIHKLESTNNSSNLNVKFKIKDENKSANETDKTNDANETNDENDLSSEYSSEEEFTSIMQKRFEEEKPRFISSKERNKNKSQTTEKLTNKKEQVNELALSLRTQTEAEEKQSLKQHREESLQLVINLSREEQQAQERERNAELAELPDDGDDIDEEAEFEHWKLRELARMKDDAERRNKFKEQQEEVRKRREMDDEKREQDNIKHGSKRYEKSQQKIEYLQKYFHKGAFYQDDKLIKNKLMERNFMAPVGEDTYTNRTLLPEVMQVKNFGLASRTKYTHLVDQDTTFGNRKAPAILGKSDLAAEAEGRNQATIMGDHRNPNNPWLDFRSTNSKRFKGIGGTGSFTRPSRKKRR